MPGPFDISDGLAAGQQLVQKQQLFPSVLQSSQAQADLGTMEVQQRQIAMQQQQKMMQIAQGIKFSGDAATDMTRQASALAQAGFTTQASAMLDKVSAVQKNLAYVTKVADDASKTPSTIYKNIAEGQAAQGRASLTGIEAKVDAAKVGLDQAEAANYRSLTAARGKAGQREPDAQAIKYIDDLIRVDNPNADPNATKVLATQGAELADRYVQQGRSRVQAWTQAAQDLRAGGQLNNIPAKQSKTATPEMKDRANMLIDDLIDKVLKGSYLTGAGGAVNRVWETAGNLTHLSNDTDAHDFQSGVSELSLMLPKLITNTSKSAKDERAMVSKLAAGLNAGDTSQNTLSRFFSLNASLNGLKPEGGKIIGKAYKNPETGEYGIYKGGPADADESYKMIDARTASAWFSKK